MQWFFDNEKKEITRRQKEAKKKGKNAGGRPPIVDEFVVAKLEQAFALDATIEEACVYAGISHDTYHKFIKKAPEFGDRFDALKELPVLMLRETVLRRAQIDGDLALKYLKNKRNGEFSERKDVKLTGGIKMLPKLDEEEANKLKQSINIFFGASPTIVKDDEDNTEDDDD